MKILNNLILPGRHGRPVITDIHYIPDGRPKPVVIFSHGYKSFKDWGPFNLIANKFAENGCIFIKFNFSHNGGTIDQVIDFPDLEAFSRNNYCIELDDLQTVIDWLVSQKDIPHSELSPERIILMGHSRGGGIAILKASESPGIERIITMGAPSSFGRRLLIGKNIENWKKDGVLYVENKRTGQLMPHLYQFYENFTEHRERLDIPLAESKLNIPHFIIHGTEDETIPVGDARELHSLNSKSELFLIPGAGHTLGTRHPYDETALPPLFDHAMDQALLFVNG